MKNELSTIVKESGLEKTKAQVLLDNFSHYFQIAADWEKKARAIVITDANQTAEMQMARTGRLFLRQKRIAIEKTRKDLKEQALREGKAIDGIANVLKALIVPVEDYLEKQEKFVEIKAAEEAERKRIEAEIKAEQEQIAREKAEAEERVRIRKENERLKKEAEERERKMVEERAMAERKRRAQEEKARKEREAAERAIKEEQERRKQELAAEREKAELAQKEKEEAERKNQAELEKREKEIASAKAKAEAEKAAYKANMIECPFCHKSFNLGQVKSRFPEIRS